MHTCRNITRLVAGTLLSAVLFISPALAQTPSPKLSDPEIASVAVTANKIDVGYGQIALKQSKSADIRKFAKTMIEDHTNIINQAVALAGKLGVTPKDNALTDKLLEGSKKTTSMLKSKHGKAFDKAYIDNEVAYHEAVISAVTDILVPQTQNAQLKALLIKVSPILKEHLAHAKMIQASYQK